MSCRDCHYAEHAPIRVTRCPFRWTSTIFKQPYRTDDTWFLYFACIVCEAQPVVVAKRNDYIGELNVIYPTAELAIQGIHRRLSSGDSGICRLSPCGEHRHQTADPLIVSEYCLRRV